MNQASKYLVLVRREFWEFRSLWITLLVAVGLLVVAALFTFLNIGHGVHITDSRDAPVLEVREMGAQTLIGLTMFFSMFAAVVTAAYLLDCLYGERKDRSILFWKSLPVSDTATVLSKLAAALLAMPLLVLAVALLLQPVAMGIAAFEIPEIRSQLGTVLAGMFAAIPGVIAMGIVTMLWYLPVAAYLMLASVVATRAPLVFAAVPIVAAQLIDWILFDGQHVWRFLTGRVMPWPTSNGPVPIRNGVLVSDAPWSHVWLEPALWLGVLVGAAMIYVVIRLRRYRDDT